ncbi:hypothetical protein [Luteolibacter luteus]|uniref:Uncharacterized protein n=1 Tax=Luteolibacter luteus TaxID=2728835 RepID=A0A858RM66_9BACT|nr:hypothetical protein [Luteolibacter luteus]QJE97280.1 hypothetical protein HHL09_16280 [Luteolibacter luteus]
MSDGEPEEWEVPPQGEQLPIAPEDQDRFRGFLTEIAFSLAGTLILGCSSFILGELKPRWTWSTSSPLWERAFYQWLPALLLLLAFACLVWLITIPLRMASQEKR